MAKIEVKLVLEKDQQKPSPKTVHDLVIEPELSAFGKYFNDKAGGGPLAGYEKEVLKAYLWWKLEVSNGEIT